MPAVAAGTAFSCMVKFNSKGWEDNLINFVSQRKSARLRRSRLRNSPGRDMAARHRESRLSRVGGRHNCATSSSSLRKFTNICKLSEIISLKWFQALRRETACAVLRSKGCSCLL